MIRLEVKHLTSGAMRISDKNNINNFAQIGLCQIVDDDIFFPHATKAFKSEVYSLLRDIGITSDDEPDSQELGWVPEPIGEKEQ